MPRTQRRGERRLPVPARITLRPATEADIPLIEPWYGEAAAIVHQLRSPAHIQMLRYQLAEAETVNGELLVILRPGKGAQPIGYVDYRLDEPAEGWLTFGMIALAAGQRGWGYGAEAVRLVEGRGGSRRFLADVNPANGLSLYFWLRQGYRPARLDEIFWQAPNEGGIISMIRETARRSKQHGARSQERLNG